jgi:hypothetical protein
VARRQHVERGQGADVPLGVPVAVDPELDFRQLPDVVAVMPHHERGLVNVRIG